MFFKKNKKRELNSCSHNIQFEDKIHMLMQLNKYDKALPLLEKLIPAAENKISENTAPDLLKIYKYYGECLIHSGKLGEALEFLNKGLEIARGKNTNPCKETLVEIAIPALEKFIKQSSSSEKAFNLLESLEGKYPEEVSKRAVNAFLERAFMHFKQGEYDRAAAVYNKILPLAEKYGCLDYDNLVRAGDSNVKCGQLNKAWKNYEMAKPLSNTYHKQCRLHKKIADLLIQKNQNWHAILHFLAALQSVPSDKGAKTKLKNTLKRLGLEKYTDKFFQLNVKYSNFEQLEVSLLTLKKQLKAG